jgi:glycosyltransferase involved in cell wall biosynthesis
MKLFIQIPCLNEEYTLPAVIRDLPTEIEGIDKVYTLIIDDGSSDRTVEVAKNLRVDFIIRNASNLGLARTYSKGLEACILLGADVIVNTDGDNQYCGDDVKKIVKQVVEKKTDVVVGCRDIAGHKEFSRFKKLLQKIGSRVVRKLSGGDVPDAISGFRAISREAAITFSVMSHFSYTIETLIQAGRSGLKIGWVPINTNPKLRSSRLFKSNFDFISKQIRILFKTYLFYCPMYFFGWLASLSFAVSAVNGIRIYYYISEAARFKTGSGTVLLFFSIITVLFIVAGMLGSVLSGLRFLVMDLRNRIRKMELRQAKPEQDVESLRTYGVFRGAIVKTEDGYVTI